ncbi:MAG: imidazolonepropionase [Alphaproteobacteria bacterium]|nr:imidazolonepropionase [Alphaproteobacteria bacterium]
MWDTLWIDGRIATLDPDIDAAYGMIAPGAVAAEGGKITWIGAMSDLPAVPQTLARAVVSLDGALVTPGLIDCHTHLVYAGDRAAEFEARLNGKSYEEIAAAGGGILSTVMATRAASQSELTQASLARLDALIAEGVTTIEIKSGYGLDLETELKMLRTARALGQARRITVKTTFLAAHAVAPEYAGRSDEYIDHVCNDILPAAHAEGLVDAVDGFCEGIGFSPAQIERVFKTARALGLPVKLHAEQLSDLGGARLAAQYDALSADHLEYMKYADAQIMAKAGTAAVLLPGAFYYLRETKLPPVDALRNANVAMAVATDSNPGTSPMTSLLLAMNMACTLFRLTPEEALAGVTRHGAAALGLAEKTGTITGGKSADLAIWRLSEPSALAYHIGYNPLRTRIFAGETQ